MNHASLYALSGNIQIFCVLHLGLIGISGRRRFHELKYPVKTIRINSIHEAILCKKNGGVDGKLPAVPGPEL